MSDKETITIPKEEFEEIKDNLKRFADYQRLTSVMVTFGIVMVILHIFADIFFHII